MKIPTFKVFNITIPIKWTWYDAEREKDRENRKKWAKEAKNARKNKD